ncbi:MAG: ABC transporter substrate-binding protein [Candidatus Heimdallarchaeaceae archaeon]
MKKERIFFAISIFLITGNSVLLSSQSTEIEPFFELSLGNPSLGYSKFIKEQLEKINIQVKIIWPGYFTFPIPFGFSTDMFITSLDLFKPDMSEYFTENGSKNCFHLDSSIPYQLENEKMLDKFETITESDKRVIHLLNWNLLLIDKILPAVPLFIPKNYEAVWSNIKNYNIEWGLVESLPYMSYDGYHKGQTSLNEFVFADSNWRDLNPLFSADFPSKTIFNLLSEPILQLTPDGRPIKTGLVDSWEKIADNHYKLHIREGVFWSPSYNTSNYLNDSIPIDNFPLMKGLKNDEYSNGTNQQVTAKDAVFTLLCWANPLISEQSLKYEWLNDCYVDENDSMSFHILIDSKPDTAQKESYHDFWLDLSQAILPEFFLNSSSQEISYTVSGIKCWGLNPQISETPQWKSYSFTPFSCGKYMLYYFIRSQKTVLVKNPNWFGVGAIDGTIGMQPFVDQIIILIIPDRSAELEIIKEEKLDWIDLTLLQNERREMETDNNFLIQSKKSSCTSILGFNFNSNIIGKKNNFIFLNVPGKENYTKAVAIKKAICYALNKEEINQQIHSGKYLLNYYLFRKFWDDTLVPFNFGTITYKHNIDLAWEWMEAAGYPRPTTTKTDLSFYSSLLIIVYLLKKRDQKRKERRKNKKNY